MGGAIPSKCAPQWRALAWQPGLGVHEPAEPPQPTSPPRHCRFSCIRYWASVTTNGPARTRHGPFGAARTNRAVAGGLQGTYESPEGGHRPRRFGERPADTRGGRRVFGRGRSADVVSGWRSGAHKGNAHYKKKLKQKMPVSCRSQSFGNPFQAPSICAGTHAIIIPSIVAVP